MFLKSGAEYEYVTNAFNKRIAFVVGWLVFLSGVLAAATVALGFAGYFSALTRLPIFVTAISLLFVLTALLAYGVKETARVAVISTFIEVSGLVVIIAIGLPHLGSVNYWELPQGYSGLFAASALIFFAFQGFESMVKFSEETKKPESTIPKALMLALLISTILYVLVALSVVSVTGWQQLAVSNAPFADIVSGTLGPDAAVIIAIVALFATANTALMSMYASSRILYGMAGVSSITAGLSWVHPGRRTPMTAIIISGFLSVILLFAGDITFIANVTNFTLFITFIVINAAVIALRYQSPLTPRAFRIPLSLGRLPLIPVAGIGFCILLLAVQEPAILILGVVLTGLGVALMTLAGYYTPRSSMRPYGSRLFFGVTPIGTSSGRNDRISINFSG